MKTDRELLELAAKAAGFSNWDFLAGEEGNLMNVYTDDATHSTWWPLEDDGDALRLAVNLRITIAMHANAIAAMHTASGRSWCESYDGDKQAATRRAIVRAAAAIGERMQ